MEESKNGEQWPNVDNGGGCLTSFPSSSSSSASSDFEFTVPISPSSKRVASQLCPADELFYKGQLLPLQLSPRLSMVRSLLLASSSTSSSDANSTTGSRDSNGSSSSSSSFSADALLLHVLECDSSRPSSVAEEDAFRHHAIPSSAPKRRYLSSFTTRFSSVFLHRGSKKDPTFTAAGDHMAPPFSKKMSTSSSASSAKEKLKKYVKKVKPLYEKLSSLQHKQPKSPQQKKTLSFSIRRERESSLSFNTTESSTPAAGKTEFLPPSSYLHTRSFSGNLRNPRRMSCPKSCPSSTRSSPSHSGLLSLPGGRQAINLPSSSSSMEELQSAIQCAIAHCKSSMVLSSSTYGKDVHLCAA
ncbi:hypothetical protein HPP92_003207 [Vanilla planifolia]|uniref:Membrane-associated kinase regulator 1 n=1 Tax=Vanilla planifolia TaxID=51239 RepID=A0A835S2K9_VANPL|nr:hypothetical protein HPP92_003207 [Vanilla planifolia]